MSTKLFVVRHGQTEMNIARVLQGRSDKPLNETGREQAAETREVLDGIGVTFAHVFSSPLIRAVDTAKIIAPGIEIKTDERLIEMDYGPYEGSDLKNPSPEIITFFSDFVNNPAPEGMEPLPSIVERAGSFIEDLNGKVTGNILISTHAIAMKGILEYLTPDSNGGYWGTHIANCEIYVSKYKDGKFDTPQKLEL